MDTLFSVRSLSTEDNSTTLSSPTGISEEENSNAEFKQDVKPKMIQNYRRTPSSSSSSYIVDYGPIRIRHRRTKSQTLATGRRSKDEPIHGEEALKREVRRTRNRLAARELKKTRDQIELDLIQKIKDLEEEKNHLEGHHKQLEERKAQLNRAVYNAKQAPLVPIIADMDIPVLFESTNGQDLLIDIRPLLEILDEQFSDLFEC